MKTIAMGAALALAWSAMPAGGQTNTPQAQALGQCMVTKTTGADRIVIARWMAAALAGAPQLADIAKVDAAGKQEADRRFAALFTRLLAKDCADQSRPLFAANDGAGFETAGEALGRIALQELLSDPRATANLSAYIQYLDKAAFKAVAK